MVDTPTLDEDEWTILEVVTAQAEEARAATGQINGIHVLAEMFLSRTEDGKIWRVRGSAHSERREFYHTNNYRAKSDATIMFEWLVDEHDLEEI